MKWIGWVGIFLALGLGGTAPASALTKRDLVPSLWKEAQSVPMRRLLEASLFETSLLRAYDLLRRRAPGESVVAELQSFQEGLASFPPELFEETCQALFEVDPNQAPGPLAKLRLLAQTGGGLLGWYSPKAAREGFRQSLDDPHAEFALFAHLEYAKLSFGQRPELAARVLIQARARYQEALPRPSALVSLFLGAILTKAKDYPRAKALYQADGARYRGVRFAQEGDLEPYFLHGLAQVYEGLGEPSQALALLERARQGFPAYPARDALIRDQEALRN